MRNTLAVGVILIGSLLVLSAIKNWKFVTTLLVVTGQKPYDTPSDGGSGASSNGGRNPFDQTVPGKPGAVNKDRPGYKNEDLEKNPDGTWKRDADGYIIIKPGAVPFDPQMAAASDKQNKDATAATGIQANVDARKNLSRF